MKKLLTLSFILSILWTNAYSQNNVLHFNGSTDYITVSDNNSIDFSNAITIETWVNIKNLSHNKDYLIASKGWCNPQNYDFSYSFSVRKGRLTMNWNANGMCGGSAPTLLSDSTAFFPSDSCVHVATTLTPFEMKLYMNGNLVASRTTNKGVSSFHNSVEDLLVGAYKFSSGNIGHHFDGEMHEFRMWNTIRTQTEIQQNMQNTLAGTEQGLVVYYPMSNGTNGSGAAISNAASSTGNVNDGVFSGTQTTPFYNVSACNTTNSSADSCFNTLHFNGNGDHITVADNYSIDFTTGFTIEAWVNMNNINPANGYQLAHKGWCNPQGNDGSYGFSIRNGKLTSFWQVNGNCTAGNGGAIILSDSSSSGYFPTDTCLHVATTVTPYQMKLYIDGVLVGSRNTNQGVSSFHNSAEDLRIGAYKFASGALGHYLDGEMREFRMWDTVRSQNDIQQTMNTSLVGNEQGLALYYPMSNGIDGNGATIVNMATATGSVNHGTFTGTAITPFYDVSTCCPSSSSPQAPDTCLNALHFNGNSDYITITDNNSIDFTAGFTIETWINMNNVNPTSDYIIASKGWCNPLGNDASYGFSIKDGKLTTVWHVNGDCGVGTGAILLTDSLFNGNFPADSCLHVATTATPYQTKLYINGMLVATHTSNEGVSSFFNSMEDLRIGAYKFSSGTLGHFFDGEMREFRMWDTVRSQNDIQQTMNTSLVGNEQGLVVYYPMANGIDGNGSTITNMATATGSINHGTFTGTATTPFYDVSACADTNCVLDTSSVSNNLIAKITRTPLQVKVYPNPFGSQINFTVNNYDFFLDGTLTLHIYNQMGQLVAQKAAIDMPSFSFESNNLSAGVYYYQISTSKKQVSTGKIIKQ